MSCILRVNWKGFPMSTLLRIFGNIRRYPGMALGVFVLAVGSTVLVLVPPLMTKRFLDVIIEEGRGDLIVSTAALAVGAIALRQFMVMGRTVLNTAFEQRVVHDLRRELFDKIQRMPLRFFDRKTSGDIMSRVGSDVPAMEKVIIQGIDQGLSGIIQIAVILAFHALSACGADLGDARAHAAGCAHHVALLQVRSAAIHSGSGGFGGLECFPA